MQRDIYFTTFQDKPHLSVPLLMKPATYRPGVVCIFLQSLLVSVYRVQFQILPRELWEPTGSQALRSFISTCNLHRISVITKRITINCTLIFKASATCHFCTFYWLEKVKTLFLRENGKYNPKVCPGRKEKQNFWTAVRTAHANSYNAEEGSRQPRHQKI